MNRGLQLARLRRTVRLGLKSLWLHRLRSLLTVLGIVFGVASVIAMLAIGEGASFEAQEQIKNLGSQNIILRSIKPPEEQKVTDRGSQSFVLQYGLTYTDLRRIKSTIPGVSVIVPGRLMRDYVWNISRRVDCEILGTVPWYPDMRNHHVALGRFFNDADMEPPGQGARADDTAEGAKPAAHRMFLPLETAKKRYGEVLTRERSGSFEAERVQLHEVTVKIARREFVMDVAEAIKQVMERHHKKKDYEIVVPLELLKRAERTKQIFNIVLGSIAAISLLVGGIGIMNIMLASVTERTREIGIRRALGARRRDITTQFLVETVILAGAGGLLGVGLGLAIPYAVTWFAGMKTIITLWSPAIAFSISALVGIIFGLYPALRAANMDPVEALRHE